MSSSYPLDLPLHYSLRLPRVHIRRPPLLVLLHGIGGNDRDFLDLMTTIDDRYCILSVRAPFSLTAGSATWFSIDRGSGVSLTNVPQAEYSREIVLKTIPEAAKQLKINPDQIFLFGFSQGAVIALGVFMTRPDLFAGILAVSGQLLPEIRSLMAPPGKFVNKPVLLLHGMQDAFYPLSLGRSTSALLATLPLKLEYHEYYMGHNLTQEVLTKAQEWLGNRLDEAGVLGVPVGPAYNVRLSSVHIKVRNIEQAISFYARFLGMRLIERTGKTYAFLSNDDSHHVMVLENVGNKAPKPITTALGLQRITFAVPDQVSFALAYKYLVDAGISVTAIDQMISWVLLFHDPDSNGLEIILDMRNEPGRSHLWQGRDLPLSADRILSCLKAQE